RASNVIAALVHQSVVERAERHEVRKLRLATVDPVNDVVALRKPRAVAARETAAAVPRAQRALDRCRYRSRLAPHTERLALLAFGDADERAVACEPPNGAERERGSSV